MYQAIAFLTQTLNKNSAIVANQEQRWKEVLDNMHNEYQKELTQKDEEFREMSERVNELIQVETQKFAVSKLSNALSYTFSPKFRWNVRQLQ
ncbi:MAG TPA: hypothetical protein VGO47_14505 [Chlamydiales bacterium]|nr:hypothetical protein [Chlamydiales bacterium]